MKHTRCSALTPSHLTIAPDLEASRPLNCPDCGRIVRSAGPGLHGHGVRKRTVRWPVFGSDSLPTFVECLAAARRFRCPACGVVVLVAHPGVGQQTRFSLRAIVALIFLGAPPPGDAVPEADLHRRATGRELPASERSRSGAARWRSWRRWVRARAAPGQTIANAARLFILKFGLRPIIEWVDAAVAAHAREDAAM